MTGAFPVGAFCNAAEHGHLAEMQELFAANMDMEHASDIYNERDVAMGIAADRAACLGHMEVLQWLLEQPCAKAYGFFNAAFQAVYHGSPLSTKFLLQHPRLRALQLASGSDGIVWYGIRILGAADLNGHTDLLRWMCEQLDADWVLVVLKHAGQALSAAARAAAGDALRCRRRWSALRSAWFAATAAAAAK